MNYPKFALENMTLCADHIKPVLQCLIHSILFHRALGVVTPREISSDLFSNISYMTCSNSNAYQQIEEKISSIMQLINKKLLNIQQNDSKDAIDIDCICIKFYQSKQRDHWFRIGHSETKEYWEQWDIKLNIIKSKKDIDLYKLEQNVKANIIEIIKFVNKNYNHLPKLPKEKELESPICYPYEITIPNKNVLDQGYHTQVIRGLKSTIKKLVENAPQTN